MWSKLLHSTVNLTYMVQLMVSNVRRIKLAQKVAFINGSTWLPPRTNKNSKKIQVRGEPLQTTQPYEAHAKPWKTPELKQDYCAVDIQYLTVGGRLKSKTSVLPWTGCMGVEHATTAFADWMFTNPFGRPWYASASNF